MRHIRRTTHLIKHTHHIVYCRNILTSPFTRKAFKILCKSLKLSAAFLKRSIKVWNKIKKLIIKINVGSCTCNLNHIDIFVSEYIDYIRQAIKIFRHISHRDFKGQSVRSFIKPDIIRFLTVCPFKKIPFCSIRKSYALSLAERCLAIYFKPSPAFGIDNVALPVS